MSGKRATIASPEAIDHHTRRIALTTMLDDVDREILAFVESYNLKTGNAPTTRQIAAIVQRSQGPIFKRINRLASIGLLEKIDLGYGRSIYLPNLPGRVYCQDFERV